MAPGAQVLKRFTVIRPKGTPPGDLQYANYASAVADALSRKGFVYDPTAVTGQTQLAVVVYASIGEPQQMSSTTTLPIIGQTGVSSSTTTGTFSPYGTYTETTSYAPQYGVVDVVPITNTWTECDRVLRIDAHDLLHFWGYTGADRKLTPAWSTTVRSRGSTCNLPEVFPYLVKLAEPGLAANLSPTRLSVEMAR